VDDSGETRTDEEVLNRRFEYFKHMIMVSTATTVAVIANYASSLTVGKHTSTRRRRLHR
jgi:hypothetical protein